MLHTYGSNLIIKFKKRMFEFALTMSIVQVCLLFGINRKTFYKWRRHYITFDEGGFLFPLSSAPHTVWNKTPKWLEDLVVTTKKQHPELGCRRLANLINAGFEGRSSQVRLTYRTVHRILQRRADAPAGTLVEKTKKKFNHFFEAIAPHKIWQMDILYAFKTDEGKWVYLIAILDDHSRFVIHAKVTPRQRAIEVVQVLREGIEHHGCPEMMLVDRGKQFKAKRFLDVCQALQIKVRYCEAGHPQTKGKIERFFRTLRKEYIRMHTFLNLAQANGHLQAYLKNYNYLFTHSSLGDQTPYSRFLDRHGRALQEAFNWELHLCIRRLRRKVKADGCILLDKQRYFLSTDLIRSWVAVTVEKEQVKVFDGNDLVATLKKIA